MRYGPRRALLVLLLTGGMFAGFGSAAVDAMRSEHRSACRHAQTQPQTQTPPPVAAPAEHAP